MYKYINRELSAGTSFHEIVRRFGQEVMNEALSLTGGNKSRAARLLKVHRNSFKNWIRPENGQGEHDVAVR